MLIYEWQTITDSTTFIWQWVDNELERSEEQDVIIELEKELQPLKRSQQSFSRSNFCSKNVSLGRKYVLLLLTLSCVFMLLYNIWGGGVAFSVLIIFGNKE